MSEETMVLPGHGIELPGGRSVWAGYHEDSSSWYIHFTNNNNPEPLTAIRLHADAAEALVRLLDNNAYDAIHRWILEVSNKLVKED